ncbi:MAG: glycosyltransferase family 2 protein [Geminicoccaceae bacterium]|nr:glycosyltransferase family 2 protein [Geminicoccaceae bacterium]
MSDEPTSDPKAIRAMLPVAPLLAVIVPTYRERDNVGPLVDAIANALDGTAFEIIIVDDDSPDGTAARARSMAQGDPRIRVIQRLYRRGLATACTEGMLATSAPFMAVIDADRQHDERLLPLMLERLRDGRHDVVIGSRYMDGGGTGDWARERLRISRIGTFIVRAVLRQPVSDPLSGFFMLRRTFFDRTARRLSSNGFKILVDLLLSAERPPRILELPYTMRSRELGTSKLDLTVAIDLLVLLAHKSMRRMLPPQFLRFLASGVIGAIVHMLALALLHLGSGVSFAIAQASATGAAMTINFAVNNRLTYRARRLHGLGEVAGLLRFYMISGVGMLANLAVADFLYQFGASWWVAGLFGTAIGSPLNFAMSSLFVWSRPRHPAPDPPAPLEPGILQEHMN